MHSHLDLKVSGNKGDLIGRLEGYEAPLSEAHGNNDNSNESDEFEVDDDEMAALDVDNIVMTHKSMIFSQSVG